MVSPTAAAGQLQPRRLRLAPADTAEGGAEGGPGDAKAVATSPPHQTPGTALSTLLQYHLRSKPSTGQRKRRVLFGRVLCARLETLDVMQRRVVDNRQNKGARLAWSRGMLICMRLFSRGRAIAAPDLGELPYRAACSGAGERMTDKAGCVSNVSVTLSVCRGKAWGLRVGCCSMRSSM